MKKDELDIKKILQRKYPWRRFLKRGDIKEARERLKKRSIIINSVFSYNVFYKDTGKEPNKGFLLKELQEIAAFNKSMKKKQYKN